MGLREPVALKLIAKGRVLGITRDMNLPTLVLLWVAGAAIVLDVLITWFWSEFPAHVFRGLWKLGWKRNEPGFWPEDVESYETWTKDIWSVWINVTKPALGELLTCSVCLGRHVSWITALGILAVAGIQAWPAALAGALSWNGIINYLLKR